MNQSNFAEIIKDRIRNQKASDRMLKVFLAIFIAGNLFFLTSTYTLPSIARDFTPTKVGETMEVGDKVVMFDHWGYSKEDKLFEILIEVEDLALDDKETLDFRCKIGRDFYKAKVEEIIDDSLYVLHVKRVPKSFSSASLTIRSRNGEEDSSGRIYATAETVGQLSEAKDDKAYLLFAADAKIEGYKKQIADLVAEQEEATKKIETSVSTIESLELKKKNQTEAEQQETDAQISKISYEAEQLQADIEDIALEKQELEARIEIQESYINSLKEGGDGD